MWNNPDIQKRFPTTSEDSGKAWEKGGEENVPVWETDCNCVAGQKNLLQLLPPLVTPPTASESNKKASESPGGEGDEQNVPVWETNCNCVTGPKNGYSCCHL